MTRLERICLNKQAHESEALAAAVVVRMKARPPKGSSEKELGRLNTWFCPYCLHWHVGHNGGLPEWRQTIEKR